MHNDELGRVTNTNVSGHNTSAAYGFDGGGNPVVTVTDPGGDTVVKVSDKAGRLKSETVGGLLTTTYQYDANGNTVSVTDPSNRVSTAAYDELNRLVSTQIGTGTDVIKTSYTYDVYGNRATEKQGAGSAADGASSSTVSYTYDKIGRILAVEQVVDAAASSANKAVTTYTYDNYASGLFYDTAMNPEGIQTKTYVNRMGLAVREEVTGLFRSVHPACCIFLQKRAVSLFVFSSINGKHNF